jgi:serine phosphatase RsbU (regulator of sigma subunit)/anti-sigma regulatory factor (Ser/Thr protein kinase)
VWHSVDLGANNGLTHTLRTARPAYFPTGADYVGAFPDSAKVLELSHTHAVACLPLFGTTGAVIGAIGYSFAEAQPFNADQRAMLETVADIAAQSLDRARLYERDRDVATTLQMALLPAALPQLDDVVTEARYVAGSAAVAVGGDWYDVLRFSDGRVGFLIGDAAGRGLEAATLMGKVRHAAAAVAMEHTSPAAVLGRVNDYLHTLSSRRAMVTCCYMVLDHDRGVLQYSSAGHPPTVVIESDGEPRFLQGGRGVPLGVGVQGSRHDAEYQLTSASTLVLYTDGLIERRGETIDVGLERLLTTIRGHADDVRDLCDHLTGVLLADASDDDVALLAVRVCSVPTTTRLDLELPADSRRLHELRVRVTRWLTEAGVTPAVIPDVVVALNEAASNSMLHAYSGLQHRGAVHVSIALADHGLTATVSDRGQWRAARTGHDGRGIQMMHKLMTDVRVERDEQGTRVHLSRAIPV